MTPYQGENNYFYIKYLSDMTNSESKGLISFLQHLL